MDDSPASSASWRPLVLAATLFLTLLGAAALPTLLRDRQAAVVFSTPSLSGVGDVQVGLGCELRGRVLKTSAEYRTNGGPVTSYEYTFGDGGPPLVVQVGNRRPNPGATHGYDRPGRYVVTLKLMNEKATGEDSCTIDVP